MYLPWLLKQFVILGGKCQKKKIHSISEAMTTDEVDVVVNCMGIYAKKLINDKDLIPTRGQNIIVKAPHIRRSMTIASKYILYLFIPHVDIYYE
jgi:D-amino-acid oxidase